MQNLTSRKSSKYRPSLMGSNKVTTTLQEHSGKPTTRASASVERAREPQGEPTDPEQTNRPRESHKSLREPRRAARTESQPRAKQRATAAVTTHPRTANRPNKPQGQERTERATRRATTASAVRHEEHATRAKESQPEQPTTDRRATPHQEPQEPQRGENRPTTDGTRQTPSNTQRVKTPDR